MPDRDPTAFLKSIQKGVGSGSGSIGQRYGSGDPDRILTKCHGSPTLTQTICRANGPCTVGSACCERRKTMHYSLILMRMSFKIMKITFQGVLYQIYYLYTTRKHLYIYHN
jgi:hypothetical protein